MKRTKKAEKVAAPAPHDNDDNVVHILVPMTLKERIGLRHKALDERRTVAMMVRDALGLAPEVPA